MSGSPSLRNRINSTVRDIPRSGIRDFFDIVSTMKDVISLGIGEPDFDTPEPVKAAAEAAIRAGFTKYTPSSGINELRQAVIDKLQSEQGLRYEISQILISCGAKHSLYNLAEALLEAGDEVIIPTPYWVSYADQTLLNDATPVLLPTREEQDYAIDPDELQRRVTAKTKAIIVNSPCNPTGATYDRKTLEAIATIALRHKILIISDEIYEKVLYDGARHLSIATLSPEMAAQTVIVNGVSKAYAMTGWRIGYAAGPKDLLTAMANIQSQSTSNACSISQNDFAMSSRTDWCWLRRRPKVLRCSARRHICSSARCAQPIRRMQ